MKLVLILATLALAAPVAHGETFAFVDPVRVDVESTEWQRVWAEIQGDKTTKDREIEAAIEAARKAKPADAQAQAVKAQKLAKMDQEDLSAHQKTARAAFEKRRAEIGAALEREKHVTILLATLAVPKPGRDLTDEVINRLNATDAQAIAAENVRLTEENARLKAEKAPAAPPKVPGAK